jgi:hypothetical protein
LYNYFPNIAQGIHISVYLSCMYFLSISLFSSSKYIFNLKITLSLTSYSHNLVEIYLQKVADMSVSPLGFIPWIKAKPDPNLCRVYLFFFTALCKFHSQSLTFWTHLSLVFFLHHGGIANISTLFFLVPWETCFFQVSTPVS